MIENVVNILQKTELLERVNFSTNAILDFFFPSFCASCQTKLISTERFVCPLCFSKIKKATIDRIEREFQRKFLCDNLISGLNASFVFEKERELQHILHALKYNGKFLLGKYLGEIVSNETINILKSWNPNLILPIPLHPLKKAERGYNQSDFICKGLSKALNIQYRTNIIKRSRFTHSQTTMTLEERKQNVNEAFKQKKKRAITGKRILLVDDVITTGATITECAKVLLENGADKIYAFSIALAD